MQRTIRLQLKPNDQEALALWQTKQRYTWSFNAVCRYGWDSNLSNGVELHKATYYEHRLETGLPSQLVCAASVGILSEEIAPPKLIFDAKSVGLNAMLTTMPR